MKRIIKAAPFLVLFLLVSITSNAQNKNTNKTQKYNQEIIPSFEFTDDIFETSSQDSCIEFTLENVRNQNKLDDLLAFANQYSFAFTITVISTDFPKSARLRVKFNNPKDLSSFKRFLVGAEIRNVKKNGVMVDVDNVLE